MVRILHTAVVLALAGTQQVWAQGNNNPPPSSTTSSSATSSSQTSSSTSSSSSSSSQPTSSSTSTSAPNLSSSTGTAPPLPTLSGVLPPPLIVPDTSGAPFMRKSNLPEGTVFIAVGAALGFLGLCVLIWRALIAWSLRRSVKRAASAAYAPDSKSIFGFGSTAGYKSMYTDSNMSLEQLGSTSTGYLGAGATKPGNAGSQDRRSKQPRATSRVPSNLFFSPTAGPGAGASSSQPTSARVSTMLPSGFYAANAPSASYARTQQTPPDSPSVQPQGTHLRPGSSHMPRTSLGASRLSTGPSNNQEQRRSRQPSTQNLNAASPTQGRAPSTHFENLLDIHGHGPSERF